MSDQQGVERGPDATGEHRGAPLGSGVTDEVPHDASAAQGADEGSEDAAGRAGSTADGTSPGSDGDGVEAGYTPPGELAGGTEPVAPTD